MMHHPHGNQPLERRGASLDNAAGAVIVFHGRGATAVDILTLCNYVERDDLAWLAPQAAGRTWYPYSFLAPLSQNEPWLSSALRRGGEMIEEVHESGIPYERIVLMGFSQGGCLALEVAARHARRYGGVIAFSGGLIGSAEKREDPPNDKLFVYEGSLDGTPVFLGCSDVDPHIPVERVYHTAEALSNHAGEVTTRIYPGMGHTINDDEVAFMRELIEGM